MTHSAQISLINLSYQLPDGYFLFRDLNEHFDTTPTGLVGRNGVGKSLLAQIMSGKRSPTSGKCLCSGSVYYLAQHTMISKTQTIAELMNVSTIINALANIEQGSNEQHDFDLVDGHWDIRTQIEQVLQRYNLNHITLTQTVSELSGGEVMQLALVGAFLSDADFLILDEPTNHLDRLHKKQLQTQLADWQKGLIVISHDRALLEQMTRIVELSSLGLRIYGGNYSFYAEAKQQEHQVAISTLEQLKLEQKREKRLLQEQHDKLEKRQAQGNKRAQQANQAKILLGRQKQRSEATYGKLHNQQHHALEQRNNQISEATKRIDRHTNIALHIPELSTTSPNKIAELAQVILPFIVPPLNHIDLSLTKGQHIALIGENGSGKSTLLKVLAGQIQPISGHAHQFVKTAYLAQNSDNLHSEKSLLEQLSECNSALPESTLRMQLAQLGLDAAKITVPVYQLSGGERLKGALAAMLYTDNVAQLLLLDEPTNHLDLASIQALEAMLCQYQGTLMVASHDNIFLQNINLTKQLEATPAGWVMSPISS